MEVRVIPARKTDENLQPKKLRVAAYCRVSSDLGTQDGSLGSQRDYYEKLIKHNKNWLYRGVYADRGSGLRISERKNLKRLLKQAEKGNIDMIITKSFSRLSRNTVDSLKIIRELRIKGVRIMFETENMIIDTESSEMVATIISAIAQNESRNISENITWGYKRKFERGEPLLNYKRFYGYRYEDGNLVINEEEAEVVRDIFDMYVNGYSLRKIATNLESRGIKTATGRDKWSPKVLRGMLMNEKYIGDVCTQKTYCEDFLTGKRRINNGEKTQYYIKDNHPAIVSEETFKYVYDKLGK